MCNLVFLFKLQSSLWIDEPNDLCDVDKLSAQDISQSDLVFFRNEICLFLLGLCLITREFVRLPITLLALNRAIAYTFALRALRHFVSSLCALITLKH